MKNSINVVSLFSGGGGLDLGFKKQDYNIIWANDNDKNAVATYKHNIGKHIVHASINDVDIMKIPAANVVIGGPPCQSFSLSGNRNPNDDRGKLVWKYIEIIDQVNPQAFVFENVTGLLSAKDENGNKVFPMLVKTFEQIGYKISAEVLNSASYGVPQKRKRVIIVGLKNQNLFEFPKALMTEEKEFVTVEEALSDLPPSTESADEAIPYKTGPKSNYQRFIRDSQTKVDEHSTPTVSELDKYVIKHVKPGGNYLDIPRDVPSKRIQRLQREGGRTTFYGRMNPTKASYTINTYFNRPNGGCFIHYSENRLITIREAMRLQSFPDSFKLISSSFQSKRSIVGNAVPPLLAENIARQLKKYIEV
ncbi:DNA cytosine methyltransferase [Alkalibacterium sp. MB6]|uniref:DNA cytosine methyltransferase n=1 Tax=Alkalibacterium sp. MB6 TaxID=2081965 RepID=UPI001379F4D2|nr:DNA cytosine methyltransferase [Alkalibacterium sp. MB6]